MTDEEKKIWCPVCHCQHMPPECALRAKKDDGY